MRKAYVITAAVLCAAVTAIAASSVSAQAAPDRKGLYADIGANWTFPTIEATDGVLTANEYQSNPGYVLGIGFGLKNNKMRLGAQVDYFAETNVFGSTTEKSNMYFYTLAGTFYPSAKEMWVRVNLGYATIDLTGSGQSASAGGFAAGLGVGYDFLLGSKRALALSPYLSYMDLFKSNDFGGVLSGQGVSAKVGLFQAGVTIGYKH